MTGKRSKRLNSALLPLGVMALVAGCGGGGAMSTPGGGTTYVPPAGNQMTTATLNLLVPGRRPASRNRRPQYVSAGTSLVKVAAVAAGAPSPWPIATSTSIPTPGPVASGASPTPIPVTMTVPVPIGNDQFMVNAYDSGGYLLSGLTTPASPAVNILPNGATSVNLQLNAAADCVMVNNVLGGAFTMKPFENQTGAQTATFTVTPCDADGYPIPAGQYLSNAITFATPAPVSIGVNSIGRRTKNTVSGPLTFSPSVITQGGPQPVTVTYPANSNAPLSMSVAPSPLPPALYGGYGSVIADPVFLVLVSNHDSGTVSVLSSDAQGTGSITPWSPDIAAGLYPGGIVGAGPQTGCAQGGQAVVFDTNGPLAITLPTPGPGNPTPVPVATQNPIGAFISPASAAAMDLSCNVYVGDSTSPGGYMYSGPLANSPTLLGGPYSTAGWGPAPITATAWLGGNVYVGLGSTSGYLNNIVNATTSTDTKIGAGTQAMVRYDNTTMIIAYQNSSLLAPANDIFLARWNGMPNVNPMASKDLGSNSVYYPIKGMAVDPAGNVWAVSSYYLYEYNPISAFFKTYNMPSGLTAPTGIAIASNGMMFITNNGVTGTVSIYNSANITGGLVGTTAQALTSYPVGTNPNGVVVVP